MNEFVFTENREWVLSRRTGGVLWGYYHAQHEFEMMYAGFPGGGLSTARLKYGVDTFLRRWCFFQDPGPPQIYYTG